MKITYDDVKMLFDYDPETGVIIWRMGTWNGHPAGWKGEKGVIRITVAENDFQATRIIWLWMTGANPNGDVQVIDSDQSNLRWNNLRVVNASVRTAGSKISVRNTSGYKGVSWAERHKKWRAKIKHMGLERILGYFDDPAAASRAYEIEAEKIWGKREK